MTHDSRRRLWILIGIGGLSLIPYLAANSLGALSGANIPAYLVISAVSFGLYGLVVILVLRSNAGDWPLRPALAGCFGFALLFSGIIAPMPPTLSTDMYRYVWDGRVQANGINPYHYPSGAPELAHLRDDAIWKNMNRPEAVTIYPPFAQVVYAITWRIFPDSVLGFKAVMILATLLAGWLLVLLLKHLDMSPLCVLILLWNPLLIFETANAGHVDALALPLITGACLAVAATFRRRAQGLRAIWPDALVGVLLGLATLVKLYPAALVGPLWARRDADGRRQLRLALPVAMLATIGAGYALFAEPGVSLLGHLPAYTREFFNIGPLPNIMMDWALKNGVDFFIPVSVGLPAAVVLVSLGFALFPARTPRQAIVRCLWPVGLYLLVSQNLFPWYAVGLLPFLAVDLRPGRLLGLRADAATGLWLFTALLPLAYTIFYVGWEETWAAPWRVPLNPLLGWPPMWSIAVQFYPVYTLIVASWLARRLVDLPGRLAALRFRPHPAARTAPSREAD